LIDHTILFLEKTDDSRFRKYLRFIKITNFRKTKKGKNMTNNRVIATNKVYI
jgi:hypothetical protein